MKRRVAVWVVAAGLHSGFASAQAAPASPDAGHPARAAVPAPAAKKADSVAAKPAIPAGYRSPFADYRPFTPQEPLKSWRAANGEVREAGGHAGLMKGGRDGARSPKGGTP